MPMNQDWADDPNAHVAVQQRITRDGLAKTAILATISPLIGSSKEILCPARVHLPKRDRSAVIACRWPLMRATVPRTARSPPTTNTACRAGIDYRSLVCV